LELSFKEDKVNGKSKCEAFLKFNCHDAAAAAKSFIESSTAYKVIFANLASKPNPFRETPVDSRYSDRDSQPRADRNNSGYDQQYYDQAYRYHQNSGRGARMGRHGAQSYQSTPYPDRDTRHRNPRDNDRRGDKRYSDDKRKSRDRGDTRDYRKY
jgi:RNA recognition motif-containing protein